jgi:hypothetical protein
MSMKRKGVIEPVTAQLVCGLLLELTHLPVSLEQECDGIWEQDENLGRQKKKTRQQGGLATGQAALRLECPLARPSNYRGAVPGY